MPTYEYECTSCGQHIEVFQRISEDPLTTCGVCGGKLRKVFHPAGIVFKGSGFYATDNRSAPKSRVRSERADSPRLGVGDRRPRPPAPRGSGSGSSDGKLVELWLGSDSGSGS